MPTASAIRAGLAYVEARLDKAPFLKGLKDLGKRVAGFRGQLGGVASGIGSRLSRPFEKAITSVDKFRTRAVSSIKKIAEEAGRLGKSMRRIGFDVIRVGGALTAPFGFGIKKAGDFQESLAKFGEIFGDIASEQRNLFKQFGDQVGRSEADLLDFGSNFQGQFQNLGFDNAEAAKVSQTLTRLSVDLASFFNIAKDEDAARALQSVFAGESEPARRRFNVDVRKAAVNAELLSKNIDPKNATKQQEAMARLSIVLRETQKAQGDAARTSGSFNNQIKRLQAGATDLAITVGNALLPFVTEIVTRFNKWVGVAAEFISKNKGLVPIVASIATGVFVLGGALIAGGFALTTLSAGLAAVLNPLLLLPAAVVAWYTALIKFTTVGQAAFNLIKSALGPILSRAKEVFGGILGLLQAGEIQKAGQLLVTFLVAEFERLRTAVIDRFNGVIVFVQQAFIDIKNFVVPIWQALVQEIAMLWAKVVEFFTPTINLISEKFSGVTDNLAMDWAGFVSFFQKAWIKAQAFVAKGIVNVSQAMRNTLVVALETIVGAIRSLGVAFEPFRRNLEAGLQIFKDMHKEASATENLGLLELEADNKKRFKAIDEEAAKRREAAKRLREENRKSAAATLAAAQEDLRKGLEDAKSAVTQDAKAETKAIADKAADLDLPKLTGDAAPTKDKSGVVGGFQSSIVARNVSSAKDPTTKSVDKLRQDVKTTNDLQAEQISELRSIRQQWGDVMTA